MYELLDKIKLPEDIKNLNTADLRRLASEIRGFLIENVLRNGGHLASNLGVVELTLALYKVFNLPEDKIIWDVGHQTYVHKILSGRKGRFSGLRQENGLSGFPKREESAFDAFNTGHSSTSISAALGIVRARDAAGGRFRVAAVIGDGALTGGLCYEAMNDAGRSENDLIVILNDNTMSISKNVGAISKHLNRLRSRPGYFLLRDDIHDRLMKLPVIGKPLASFISKIKNVVKYALIPGIVFEGMGFRYFGPVDGHNIGELTEILKGVAAMRGPVLLHVLTVKGMGYGRAESDPQKFHGVAPNGNAPNTLNTGAPTPAAMPAPATAHAPASSFSDVFGSVLLGLAASDKSVTAICAAMSSGVGLDAFSKEYPERFFDVGIAEQHALTLAAGMSLYGLRPVTAIYSTFMQRAYDQVLHDICLQKAHVVMAIDRAGIVGEDGETHQGIYDIAFLRHMPNITIMAPAHDGELAAMLKYALYDIAGPAAIRYPKGIIAEADICDKINRLRARLHTQLHAQPNERPFAIMPRESFSILPADYSASSIEYGKGELLATGSDITIAAAGAMLGAALGAAEALAARGYAADVISARFIKPFDADLIINSVRKTGRLLAAEDGCVAGGFGSSICERLSGIKCATKICGLPDMPIAQGGRGAILKKHGLDEEGLLAAALDLIAVK